jgi:dTMP kinase
VFFTLEGPEGSGKTTQAQRLVSWLREMGKEVLAVREPGGTEISNAIRHILLDFGSGKVDARTELLLFCASRAQLVSEKILPHLAQGGIVVCDRFADSTLAYQGYARGLNLTFLRLLLDFATNGLKPDLTLLLDIEVNAGLGRKADNEEWNRLDAEDVGFHARVRNGYHALAAADPKRWVILDAGHPPDVVAADIQRIVGAAMTNKPRERPQN